MNGEYLKYKIKENGYTQRSFAKKIKVTESCICRYVKNEREPTGTKLLIIINALKLKDDEIIKLLGADEK